MKKIISVILVLVLCLSAASALAATKSPTVPDYYDVYPTPKQEGKFTVDLNSKVAADLLEMLKKAESVDAFFGEVIIDDKGNTALLSTLLETENEKLVVNEFVGVTYDGPTNKEVDVTITVPSVYKVGEKVIVVIGVVNGEEVTWYAFEGEVKTSAGGVSTIVIKLTPAMFKEMKGKECVIAIVSVAEAEAAEAEAASKGE